MSTFDPEVACRGHDKLNDQVLIWKPEWADDYRQHTDDFGDGVIEWDDLLLDGWSRCRMKFASPTRAELVPAAPEWFQESQCASPMEDSYESSRCRNVSAHHLLACSRATSG